MAADLQDQLEVLGAWLEEECDATLRSLSIPEDAEPDHAAVLLEQEPRSADVRSFRHWPSVVVGGRARSAWPLVAAAAAVLVVVFILTGGDESTRDQIFTDSEQTDPGGDGEVVEPGPTIAEPTATTVVLSTFDGTAVDSEMIPPEIVASQMAPSSIGDLQWTVWSGEAAVLQELVGFPGGFALVSDDGELLISDDAVEWRVVESPFPGRLEGASADFGEPRPYRMSTTTEDGDREIWVSSDFVTWTLRDPLPEAMAAGLGEWITGPEFLEIEFGLEDATETPEGATLVDGSFAIDWEALALRFGGDDLRQRVADGEWIFTRLDPATGIVEVYLRGSSDNPNAIEVQPGDWFVPAGVQIRMSISGTVDDWVIEFEDVASGEVIGSVTGSLPGLAPEDRRSSSALTIDDTLETLATGLGANFLARGDALELVDHPPWLGLPGGGPGFVLTDDWLYAYYDSGAWRSPDGRTWESLDTDLVPGGGEFVEGPSGVLVAAEDQAEGSAESSSLLRSDDGVEWARPSQPPVITDDQFWFSQVVATESGFLLVVYENDFPAGNELVMWTSEDGDIWEKVEAEEPFDLSTSPGFGQSFDPSLSSNGSGVVITDTESPTTMWKIEIVGTP